MTRHKGPIVSETVVPMSACPFCEGQFSVARKKPSREPFLLHTVPPCARYLALEVADYLAAVRVARGN